MKRSINRYTVLLIASVLLAWSCAQQMPLTGGEKDTTPPKIEESSPRNFSTNYKGNKIALTFDEFIQVKSLTQNVIVSPPLEYPLEHIIKGKSVIISIEDTLKPNTTYNFNFGEAIVDLNESNPLDSNLFVFSTGPVLDSLTISGQLKDGWTLEPVKDISLYLYLNHNDSAVLKTRPDYIGKTDQSGNFTIPYLPNKPFKIYAVGDKDQDYEYDPFAEEFAYLEGIVNPGDSVNLEMKTFTEQDTAQRLLKTGGIHYGQAFLKFQKTAENITLKPIGKTVNYISRWNDTKDSLTMWFPDYADHDTIRFQVLTDTILDTAEVVLKPKEKFINKKTNEPSVKFRLKNSYDLGRFSYFDTLWFYSDHPIQSIDKKNWVFSVNDDTLSWDSLLKNDIIRFGQSPDDSLRSFSLLYDWKPAASYSITIPDSSIKDIFELSHDTLEIQIKTKKFEDYGKLALNLNLPDTKGQYLYLLLDDKQNVAKKMVVQPDEKIVFPLLEPGKYEFKIIVDENKNGKWDTGNFFEKQQPEAVFYYPKTADVRANWEVELDWTVEDQSLISN
ncbi:Ig-like domain-containing protein [Salibacter halophilus]|uniref:SbsA Ig-like domain-containing protein n=1 Tax=Salibacter halophilus TaxID=1803916 RepID=A0A6N6M7Z5_9FLAO|nr:Ig-like domain-containing protein [Salibacter halophilus]KAB1064043.1 hypothetical protein F3059_08385 [Salibacter halophilus]